MEQCEALRAKNNDAFAAANEEHDALVAANQVKLDAALQGAGLTLHGSEAVTSKPILIGLGSGYDFTLCEIDRPEGVGEPREGDFTPVNVYEFTGNGFVYEVVDAGSGLMSVEGEVIELKKYLIGIGRRYEPPHCSSGTRVPGDIGLPISKEFWATTEEGVVVFLNYQPNLNAIKSVSWCVVDDGNACTAEPPEPQYYIMTTDNLTDFGGRHDVKYEADIIDVQAKRCIKKRFAGIWIIQR